MNEYVIGIGIAAFLLVLFRKELNGIWDWVASHNTFGKIVDRERSEKP